MRCGLKKCDEWESPKEGVSLRYVINLDRQMKVHRQGWREGWRGGWLGAGGGAGARAE